MKPLAADSPRRLAASRFGAELRKAMTARGIGPKSLGPQCHVSPSGIGQYRSGTNLPTVETATRLAHALDWPALMELAQDGRRSYCVACGRSLVTEGGRPRRYCSAECAWLAAKKQRDHKSPGVVLAEAVESELDRVRSSQFPAAVSRRTLSAAVAEFHRTALRARRVIDLAEKRATDRQASIDAMCGECEPEGMCRTPECPLRPYSPLPLSKKHLSVDVARKPEGPQGPTNRPAWLAAVRAGNARRWTPEEREQGAERMRRWWQDNPDHADRVRAGNRARDERRRTATA